VRQRMKTMCVEEHDEEISEGARAVRRDARSRVDEKTNARWAQARSGPRASSGTGGVGRAWQ